MEKHLNVTASRSGMSLKLRLRNIFEHQEITTSSSTGRRRILSTFKTKSQRNSMEIDVIGDPLRVIYEGYLVKSPPESKLKEYRRWKKRYFRLWSNKRLEYFKDEKAKEGIKEPIDLTNCKPEGNLEFRSKKNVFSIKTDNRKYYFVAKTPEVMRNWMMHISSLCNLNARPESTPPSSPGGFYPGSQLHLKAQSSPTEMRKRAQSHLNKDRSLPSVLDSNANGSESTYKMVPPPKKISYDDEPLPALPISAEVSLVRPTSSRNSCGTEYDLVPAPRPSTKRLSSNSSSSSAQSRSPDSMSPVLATRPDVSKSAVPKRDSYVEMANGPEQSNAKSNDSSLYDCVPPPRPARPITTSSDICEERSYVEMQKSSSDQSTVIPPPLPDQTYSGYDFIPKVNSSTDISLARDQFECLMSGNSNSHFTTSQSDGAISAGSISSGDMFPPQVNRSVKPKSAAAPAVNRRRKPTSGGSGSDAPPRNNEHTYSNDFGELMERNTRDVFADSNENIDSTPTTPGENDSLVSMTSSNPESLNQASPTSTPTSPQNNRKKPLHYADVKFATAQKNIKKSFKIDEDTTPYSVIDRDLTAAINLAIKEQGKDSPS